MFSHLQNLRMNTFLTQPFHKTFTGYVLNQRKCKKKKGQSFEGKKSANILREETNRKMCLQLQYLGLCDCFLRCVILMVLADFCLGNLAIFKSYKFSLSQNATHECVMELYLQGHFLSVRGIYSFLKLLSEVG